MKPQFCLAGLAVTWMGVFSPIHAKQPPWDPHSETPSVEAPRGVGNPDAPLEYNALCAYAIGKTDNAYPDLCEVIASDPVLGQYWALAQRGTTTKIVWVAGLGLVSLLFTSIAMSNLEHNINDCLSVLFTEEDCEEKPVLPFQLVGTGALIADLFVIFIPNQSLRHARQVTRDHYRDRLRSAPAVREVLPPAIVKPAAPTLPEPPEKAPPIGESTPVAPALAPEVRPDTTRGALPAGRS